MTRGRARVAGAVLTAAGLVGGLTVLAPAGPAGAAEAVPPVGRTVDECFVEAVLPIFARRPATAEETADALARLAAGTTRGRLARDLGRSDAWVHGVVTDLYQNILQRPPEPAGLAYWSDRLRAGASVSDLAVAIWTSPEVVGQEPGATGLLRRIFFVLLPGVRPYWEFDYWEKATERRGWDWTARQLYRTAEHRGRRVDALYRAVLGRRPEPAGRAFWVERLLTVNEVELAIQLAASAEFTTRSARTCTPLAPTVLVPGGTSPTISDDGSIVTFWSARSDLVEGDTNGRVDLFVLDRTTDEVTRVFVGTPPPVPGAVSEDATISGDGSTVVFSTRQTLVPDDTDAEFDIYLWDRASGALTLVSGIEPAGGADLSADGRRVAWSSADTVYVWEAEAGETTTIPPVEPTGRRAAGGVRLSADGSTVVWTQTWIAVCCQGQQYAGRSLLRLADLDSGATQVVAEGGSMNYIVSDVDADGATVAFVRVDIGSGQGGPDSFLRVWDRATGTTAVVPGSGGGDNVASLVPSIDGSGTRIVYGFYLDVWLHDATRGLAPLVRLGPGRVPPRISGDGRHVVAQRGQGPNEGIPSADLAVVMWDEVPVSGP